MKVKRSAVILIAIVCFLTVVLIAANIALSIFDGTLDKVFGTVTYMRNEEDVDKAIENSRKLALEVEEEGAVLLMNKDYLPKADITKVNMFGWASYSPISCMVGSGAVANDADRRISLTGAFEEAGISYNTDIEDMYGDLGFDVTASTRAGNADYHLYEAGKEDIDGVMDSAKKFSDVAIITLGRAAGESTDVPLNTDEFDNVNGQSLGVKGKHYLELSDREKYMIDAVSAAFDNVIVLLNNANVMELGYLDDIPQIKAILSIGLPGDYGFSAVPKILRGEVSPSGRTADTYAYDVMSAPSAQIPQYNVFGNVTLDDKEVYWVTYNEGIYVGYRYYETRYVGNDNVYSDAEEAEYRKAVKYPFGYGLSYTEFDWAVTRTELGGKGGLIEVTVNVTNKGDVPGKDVVELYYTAPYTVGGIEKPYVVLGAFAKTNLIAPGESDEVTLTMNVDDMASYDYRGEKCYVLEEGTYELKLQTDAHVRKAGVDVIEYEVPETVIYRDDEDGARSTDKTAAVNHFDNAGIEVMSDKESASSYLSRADWEGTWPDLASKYEAYSARYFPVFGNSFERTYNGYKADASEEVINGLRAGWWENYDPAKDPNNKYYENAPITTDTPFLLEDFEYADTSAEDYAERIEKKATVVLDDMTEVPYSDDETWNRFIAQMSLDEMLQLYQDGGYMTIAVDSIGKSAGVDLDGPAGVSDYMSLKNNYSVCWPSANVMAQTWNTDIARKMGQAFGNEALTEGCTGIYAPACNIHRSPFGGRNGEYYSEDGTLAGKICGAEVRGLRESGIVVWVKHFALNNQETLRDVNGLCTFANEQSIREVYLRPFELAVKEGNANGFMNSYNRIGYIWTGMNSALQMDVARGEWGFEGAIITDFFIVGSWADNGYMGVQAALKAGTDLLLTGDGYEKDNPPYLQRSEAEADNYTQQALRSMAKHILYAQAQGSLMQIELGYGWRIVWYVLDGVVVAGIIVMIVFIVRIMRKKDN